MNPHASSICTAFAQARQSGLRAREAAAAVGLSEGAALAAHVGQSGFSLTAQVLRPAWLSLLQSLQACGPLMALTRNDSVVIEKTGVYQNLSANGHVALALGEDIDLRLFFNQWHAGFVVREAVARPGAQQTSLQFYDRHGMAVHKIYSRDATDADAWERVLTDSVETGWTPVVFEPPKAKESKRSQEDVEAAAFAREWGAMTDTHQFFGLLNKFGLTRQRAFRAVEGRFTHRVEITAVREMLMEAAYEGLPIMCFVGSPGCIQIHTGSIRLVEPMEGQGKTWLNVLDPGFNLHLREDLIDEVWVVEKPTEDGAVTSLEVFDAQGEQMAMFFGARKPGQTELTGWRVILAHLPQASGVPA